MRSTPKQQLNLGEAEAWKLSRKAGLASKSHCGDKLTEVRLSNLFGLSEHLYNPVFKPQNSVAGFFY